MADPKTIPIEIVPTVRPPPEVVSQDIVRKHARDSGHPRADDLDIAGITVPYLVVDQTKIHYVQRRNAKVPGGIEFRYDKGTLHLTSGNRIYMSSTLSECERKIWETHELEHVKDNERLSGDLLDRLEVDGTLKAVFIMRQWYPRNDFNIIQTSIEAACGNVFRELTAAAVKKRDTAAEYERVRAVVRETCG